uniref:BACK domain-containing protein n=1 Tax=Panagrolaimus superbus TaxID=310955 RepID=A0A914Y6A9_9BILA
MGNCEFTLENIFEMVDIAHYFDVSSLKQRCDEYLSKLQFSVKNALTLFEASKLYSLSRFKRTLSLFLTKNLGALMNTTDFGHVNADTVKTFLNMKNAKHSEEQLFEGVYKWAKHQCKSTKKGIQKQDDLNAEIKTIIQEFLPHFSFDKMKHEFLIEFVKPKNILTSIEFSTVSENIEKRSRIVIKNGKGQELFGNIYGNDNICLRIKILKNVYATLCKYYVEGCEWDIMVSRPNTPSKIKKNSSIEYYLVLSYANKICIKDPRSIYDGDYLIAELSDGNAFRFTDKCLISIF